MAKEMIKEGTHGCTREELYIKPTDTLIQERLEWFQDQKLALMMHFGPYAQLDINPSWALSDGDAYWARRNVDWETDPVVFRQQYINLNKSFNPIRIQPEKWADFAANNGFKYLIFTTKHHDGFCMFDSKYTDYKVTAEDCPFHTHKYANIVKEVFDAFRKKDIGIAAYFSKPDWHCPWYWAEGMERPVAYDRNPTYNPKEHPELWEKFTEYTHNQIMELVENYGKIDILWLDGGQVNPAWGQDIQLSQLLVKARAVQPWLISADRTVGGENENYITPESCVPSEPIRVPWETCVTLGSGWGYNYNNKYMTPRQLVHMLINVVCRGGNLALNIGPQPDGLLPAQAIKIVSELGAWLRTNGEAIYGTRMAEPNEVGRTAFTKKGEIVYALERLPEGELLAEQLLIPWKGKVEKIKLLGLDNQLVFREIDEGIEVQLPYWMRGSNPLALAFRME